MTLLFVINVPIRIISTENLLPKLIRLKFYTVLIYFVNAHLKRYIFILMQVYAKEGSSIPKNIKMEDFRNEYPWTVNIEVGINGALHGHWGDVRYPAPVMHNTVVVTQNLCV